MQRYIGTVVRGIRTPIVKSGDNLVDIVVDSLGKAIESENISMKDRDVVAVTESLVARAQNNYVSVDDIACDINKKYDGEIGIVFPILSRNRFSTILRGIAKSGKKIHFLFSYPSDEVGNSLMDPNLLYETKINPFTDVLEEKDYRRIFGLTESINGSGYNKEFGLLGSNFASESKLKLFPRDGEEFVNAVQKKLIDKYNKEIEVMIYGDGAFKDPVGKIWELADPVVSPAHTKGLAGTPSELKIKYIADTDLKDMDTEHATAAMKEKISHKNKDLVGTDETLGTTPRRITDLLGSLCDLTSGSGDKGTPVVLIQGYFDNFATE